jgi:hypothetical protein
MDKRLHSRVSVENQCKARFQLGGRSYNDIIVSNLGPDGCCMRIPSQAGQELDNRITLEGWSLVHPNLPKDSIKAKVVWNHAGDRAKAGYIECGVQFMNPPADYTRNLSQFVNSQTGSMGA